MVVVTRYVGEQIVLSVQGIEMARIELVRSGRNRCRIGVHAPKTVMIDRAENLDAGVRRVLVGDTIRVQVPKPSTPHREHPQCGTHEPASSLDSLPESS